MESNKGLLRCKIVVVGDTQCGKTALLHVFAKDSYPENYVPTVFENYTASFEIDKQRIELNMWDTSGDWCLTSGFLRLREKKCALLFWSRLSGQRYQSNVKLISFDSSEVVSENRRMPMQLWLPAPHQSPLPSVSLWPRRREKTPSSPSTCPTIILPSSEPTAVRALRSLANWTKAKPLCTEQPTILPYLEKMASTSALVTSSVFRLPMNTRELRERGSVLLVMLLAIRLAAVGERLSGENKSHL
ncbi:Rho-related GTP-binding protein RhoE [Liparis tanakae]|uniref:Rho-related GTP-binding protein RhoE n=1 Tax=Liparis tanakae TaxID=230148 RepID=A0A4Z2G246_9TELE|nr:Rho-related GTP-binding protein RhoE [Liparis tanakae]